MLKQFWESDEDFNALLFFGDSHGVSRFNSTYLDFTVKIENSCIFTEKVYNMEGLVFKHRMV